MTNREEIVRALRLLFSKGDVFEVRIMNYRDASIRGIYYIPKSKTNCEV